jgi:hypothetical protein
VQGGPVLGRAGERLPLYASDSDEIWVWDEDTNTRVTDLLDANANPVTSAPISDGWVDGIGVPVAVAVPSFSVGQFGKRMSALPVQTLKNAASSLAPTAAQIDTVYQDTGSDFRIHLDTDLSSTIAAAVAPKVGKGEIVYRAADYASVQDALDDAPAGASVLLEPGNTVITSALSVTRAVTLRGHTAFGSRLVASGCNGVEVADGLADFRMEGIEVASQTRHSVTPNTLVGIKVGGATGSRPTGHVYRDVYVDGFQTAFMADYLWSSTFSNFRCNYGKIGLDIYGLSVNNFVNGGCQISVVNEAGSRGIRLAGQESVADATDVASEGWQISDTLVFGAEVNVEIIGTTHVGLADCIIDYATLYGVVVKDNGTNFGGNVSIHDSYIAMTGAGGQAAIGLQNAVSNSQNRGNRIHDNHIITYAGSACQYGVYVSGSQAKSNIHDNVLDGFAAADIRMQIAGNRVTGNECLSVAPSTTANIYSTFLNEVANNVGVVYWPGGTSPVAYSMVGGIRETYADGAPTTGTWGVGDRCRRKTPAVGSPKALLCTVAGTPGTWVSEGNL